MSRIEQTPRIFVSYSRHDKPLRELLSLQLAPLVLAGQVELWNDEEIRAGDEWEPNIMTELARAAIAVLIVTPHFLASEFIRDKEVPLMLERRARNGLRLVPILAKDCLWEEIPWLRSIQMLPRDAKPVWRNDGDPELALKLIAIEIRGLAEAAAETVQRSARGSVSREEMERQRSEVETSIAELSRNGEAALAALEKNDSKTAMALSSPSAPEEQKRRMLAWAALQNTQSRIFDLMQEAMRETQRKSEEAAKRWDRFIEG